MSQIHLYRLGLVFAVCSLVTMLFNHTISAQEPKDWGDDLVFHTFSIAAVDPSTGESGVAVTTRVPCVGNGVPWVRAGVGAVATQASTRTAYGAEQYSYTVAAVTQTTGGSEQWLYRVIAAMEEGNWASDTMAGFSTDDIAPDFNGSIVASYQSSNQTIEVSWDEIDVNDLDYYTCADLHSEIVIPKQGFDKFVTYDEDKADIMSRHSDLIENFSKTDKNFFLYLHYSKIHTGIRDSVLKVYTNFSEEYFKNRKLNEQRYDKLFKESEIYLKNILDKIYSVNLHQNSLILIMSDHGISVGEKIGEIAYGAFCYDYTLRTFAFISWPKIKPIEIHQQVRSVDFMPTVLDLLGIVTDSEFEQLDGESLIPLQIGKKMKEKIAYSETGNPFNQSKPPKEPNTMSVRTSKWKLIQNKHNNTEELYDLENDPSETTNLAGTNLYIENVLRKELVSLSG